MNDKGMSVHMLSCSVMSDSLCGPMDCSPSGSSVHGIFQIRILEWTAISDFKRDEYFSYIRKSYICIKGFQRARDSFHLRKDACSLQHTFSSQKKTCSPFLQGGM